MLKADNSESTEKGEGKKRKKEERKGEKKGTQKCNMYMSFTINT